MARFVITDLIGNPAGKISISDDGVESIGDLPGKALLEPLQAVASEKVMTASAVDGGDGEPSNPSGETLIEPDTEDRYRAVNRYLISEGLRPVPMDDEAKNLSMDSSPRQIDTDTDTDTDASAVDSRLESQSQSQSQPFSDIPVLPDDLETLTEAWLNRWAEWVAAGRPEISDDAALVQPRIFAQLDWNPALHPRDPDTGQFVERSFGIPDSAPNFDELNQKETLQYLALEGEEISPILDPQSDVTVDGVPNDATDIGDIPEDPEGEANPDTVGSGPDIGVDTPPSSGSDTDGDTGDDGDDGDTDSPDEEQNWGEMSAEEFASEYDRDAAEESVPLLMSDASAGVTANAMEVEALPDGTKAYVTNYGAGSDEAKKELYEREKATYDFLTQTGNDDNIAAHSFAGDFGNRQWSASREVDGDSGYTTSATVDRDEYVDAAAAQVIAGNNDLHQANINVADDGSFNFIDLDHSAGRLDEPDPGGTYDSNRERALSMLTETGSGVLDGSDTTGLRNDIESRAREKARQIDERDGFTPSTSMEDNIASNIRTLADEARELSDDEDDAGDVDDDAEPIPDVTGLGQAKVDSLRSAGFETRSDIEDASTDELRQADGVGPKLADRLKDSVSGGSDESDVGVSDAALADADTAIEEISDDIPDSPDEAQDPVPPSLKSAKFMSDETAPLLKEDDATVLWQALRDTASTPEEREAVGKMKTQMEGLKGQSYSDYGQTVEKAFDEAFDLPGEIRNDQLDGDDPTDAEVWAAERVAAMHQRLAERLYGDEIEVHRGIQQFGSAQVGVAAVTQLASDSDDQTITFSENKFANYSPIENVTSNFEDGFKVSRTISPDDVVHFNDMTNSDGAFKDEAEIAPATGETEVGYDQLEVNYEFNSNTEQFFEGDPDEMKTADLRAWMQTLDRIEKEQTAQENISNAADTANIDFFEKMRQGTSADDVAQLRDIVDAARDKTAVNVPNSVDRVLGAFEVEPDMQI